MRVKVVEDWERILTGLGAGGHLKPKLFVARGKAYTVYGLSLPRDSAVYRAGQILCHLVDDHGNLVFAPIGVFDVTDDAIPEIWRVAVHDGDVVFWPDIFHREYFFDDLSDGDPECVAAFQYLRSQLGDAG